MRNMLIDAGFTDINIAIKENAADIIKDWMPGSGAEKYVTSAYVTATKKASQPMRDDVRHQCCDPAVAAIMVKGDTNSGPGA
mmetsp:Transcript_72479/g.169802  ORF Transcript_72479/g.169802 Transcript_72479/m.169802 type:complete len:82 (+) Transcript_72479:1077-1322(+)